MRGPSVRRWWRRSGLRRKRALDLVLAVPAAIVLLPVGLAVAAAIRVDLGTPVLFRQRRPGVGGEVFEMVKFRTMRDATDAQGRPLPDAERLTRFGRWLRASSLDELPELVNVIRGEMSLVGPRPALASEMAVWDPELYNRLRVKPGITGMWQVNGRSNTSFADYQRLDLYYVDNWSILVDVGILAKTLPVVLSSRGAM